MNRNRPDSSPRSDSAESALLGALLLEPAAWDSVVDLVVAEDFASSAHRMIFEAIQAAVRLRRPLDAVVVADHLDWTGDLQAVGGPEYLARLVEETPGAANVRAYAERVLEYSQLRHLQEIGQDLVRAKGGTAAELAAAAGRRLEIIGAAADTHGVRLVNGRDLSPAPISWLWRGYLARGKLHIAAGAPGGGKTTIAMAFGATVTVAGRWPDGARLEEPDNVLIWSGEDDAADTLLPKLLAMGADPSRVHFIGDVSAPEGRRPFDPSQDIGALFAAVRHVGSVGLVVVDPVVNVVPGDSNKNAETRRALQPLVDLAGTLNAVVLGVSHYTKGSQGRDPVDRVTGSVAFGALPRIVFGVAKATGEDAEAGHLLVRAKSNIGPDGGGFGYDLEQEELEGHPGVVASVVRWGSPFEGSARALLATAETVEDDEERTAVGDAEEFLLEELAAGPVRSTAVVRDAKEHGIAERTLNRAKKRLNIASSKSGTTWHWSLPQGCQAPTPDNLGKVGNLDRESAVTGVLGRSSGNLAKDANLAEGRCRRCDGEGCAWCSTEAAAETSP